MRTILFTCLILGSVVVVGVVYARAGSSDRIVSRNVDAAGLHEVTVLSRTHTIDRVLESMQGPASNLAGMRLTEGVSELLWITRLRTTVVEPDGVSPTSREFFCHANLTFAEDDPTSRRAGPVFAPVPDLRLATLVPGRLDLQLPDGFGLPVYSDEPLDYYSMALNLNEQQDVRRVRFRTTLSFVPDRTRPTM